MQGLVTVDFGNSNPHAGLFQKDQKEWQLIKVVAWSELSLFLSQLGMNPNNSTIVLSSVKDREEELFHYMQQGFLLTRVKDYWRGEKFAGMPVHYSKTLGEDRLIEAFYCYKKQKIPTLIIDAGTFVTIDVVTTDGFKGGYIVPGPQTYFETFQKGELLKDLSLEAQFQQELPQNTQSAMTESYTAFAALAKNLITEHHIQKIVLTGGKSALWEGFLQAEKGSLVVETQPHLIHWALHYWMTTQIELL